MKKRWMNIGMGLFFGVLMSILMLYMMISSMFSLFSSAFWISCAVACALPHCLFVIKKYGFSPVWVCICMIAISFGITLLYGVTMNHASNYSNVMRALLVDSSILHALSLISLLARCIVHRKMK